MKHSKRFFALLLALAIVGSNVYLFSNKATAAGSLMVFVNNTLVDFADVEPQIINERTMVPVRALSDAIGATIDWNDEEKKVTIVSGDRYAVLKIGLNVMTYGTITRDSDGKSTPGTTEQYQLDSPPVIVDERSLFPARAIAEAFGAEVEWVDATGSVYITTYAPRPADMESEQTTTQASAIPSAGPANPVFADTEYFQEVSGKRVEDMHTAKMNFAVVIYDGQSSSSVSAMPSITRSAQSAQFKVYGFDVTSTRFPNPDNLKWVWTLIDKSSANYPVVILSYEGQLDEVLPSDISESDLVAKLTNLSSDYPLLNVSASPSASPSSSYDPWASPSPSPSSSVNPNYVWSNVSPRDAETRYYNSEKFVYVLYDETSGSYRSGDLDPIRQAAQNVGVKVYYYDVSRAVYSDMSWIYSYYGDERIPDPFILIIKDRSINHIGYTSSVTSLESDFKSLVSN